MRWFRQHQRELPWRHTTDPYKILVSEIMLQQTQVDRVIPKYREFLRRFPNVRALARATPREVLLAWAGMGYNRRALYLLRAAREVVERYGGKVPTDPALLQTLPGVGAYTAAAVATFSSGVPHALADTNVKRVVSRVFLGLTHGSSSVTSLRGAAATRLRHLSTPSSRSRGGLAGQAKQTHRLLSFPRKRESGSPLSRGRHEVSLRSARNDGEWLTPTAFLRLVERTMPRAPIANTPPSLWGHAVMDFGALVCKAKPRCEACPLQQWCKAYPQFQRLRRDSRVVRRGSHDSRLTTHDSLPDRIYRGRILQTLRERDPRPVSLIELLEKFSNLPRLRLRRLVRGLAADGLLVMTGRRSLRLPAS